MKEAQDASLHRSGLSHGTQTVCWCDTATGECGEQELENGDLEEVRRFYQQFKQAVVGVESVGYAGWFHRLIEGLGHELLVGEAREIRKKGGLTAARAS